MARHRRSRPPAASQPLANWSLRLRDHVDSPGARALMARACTRWPGISPSTAITLRWRWSRDIPANTADSITTEKCDSPVPSSPEWPECLALSLITSSRVGANAPRKIPSISACIMLVDRRTSFRRARAIRNGHRSSLVPNRCTQVGHQLVGEALGRQDDQRLLRSIPPSYSAATASLPFAGSLLLGSVAVHDRGVPSSRARGALVTGGKAVLAERIYAL